MNKINQIIGLIFTLTTIACNFSPQNNSSIKANQNVADNKTNSYTPILISDQLPDVVEEQSGMIWYNNKIWVNNDSGGKPELYAYNVNGELKQILQINNVSNDDWEALADDDKYFYIGDFGNNYGTRKNLKLYRIDKSIISNDSVVSVSADEINFSWADQKEFKSQKHNNNYDCEAFFSYGDSLYLFSKNWEDHKTRLYSMSKSLSTQKLYPINEFDSNLMITGADINSDGSVVALIGYKDFRTYMILFYNFEKTNFFSGQNIKLDLASLGGAQTEGVVFTDDDELLISTEATNQKHSVYKIEWKQWIK